MTCESGGLWDLADIKQKDDCLQLIHSIMASLFHTYFGCYQCTDTRKTFKAIDIDSKGLVDCNEFMVYCIAAI